jgi:integrase
LGELERRAEKIRSGVITAADAAVSDAQISPLTKHIDSYLVHLEGKGVSPAYLKPTRARLERVARDLHLSRLGDLEGERLEMWLREQAAAGMGAGNRNEYRGAWVRFCNWAVRTKRLAENPFRFLPLADAKTDRRRKRRALSEDELERLIAAARERGGEERALTYKLVELTGLRRGELSSLKLSQAELDGPSPRLRLEARDAKNRWSATIPLRHDLAEDLRAGLATRLAKCQEAAMRKKRPVPLRLEPEEPLLRVPGLRTFNHDLEAAKIAKRDPGGRAVDFHSLR